MKLTAETIAILKNFATINESIVIKPGSYISTRSPDSDFIIAGADITETFPKEFGIYNLNEFLSIMSMFGDPDIDFTSEYKVTIKDSDTKVNYAFYSPLMMTAAPKGVKEIAPPVAKFELPSQAYVKLVKAAQILSLPELAVKGDGSTITISASNDKLNDSNSYVVDIGETEAMFQAFIKVECLKMIPGSYNVSVYNRNLKFGSMDRSLSYWIALDKKSRFS